MTSIRFWHASPRLALFVLGRMLRIAAATLALGLLSATLLRFGPGFDVDEREMDARLNDETKRLARSERRQESDLGTFYVGYLKAAATGDFGISRSYNQPVAALVKERLPVTLVSLWYGVAGGIALGLTLALGTVLFRAPGLEVVSSVASGACLCVPSGVIALLFLWTGANGRWAIPLVVFPHVYRYVKNIVEAAHASPHVLTAIAKGLRPVRILYGHILLPVASELASVAGMAVTLAFGAAIPIEVICDSPGIGQLVCQAALGRDLPLMIAISMMVALMTMIANGMGDAFLEVCQQP